MPRKLVESLLRGVEAVGGRRNIIAYSGGVDSSLVAALVHKAFPDNTVACIGRSAALPQSQLDLAREVAAHIGVALQEVETNERAKPEYVANAGQACFHCKTELYGSLKAVAEFASADISSSRDREGGEGGRFRAMDSSVPLLSKPLVVIFNGTNLEDRSDPTRVGLKAAENYGVASPIRDLTKAQVRDVARHLGLPNWNHAASPCLRSRLAFGVPANDEALVRVEQAELMVREALRGAALDPQRGHLGEAGAGSEGWPGTDAPGRNRAALLSVHHNVRVRVLSKQRGVIEVDPELLEAAALATVADAAFTARFLGLGFSSLDLRPFKSGAVAMTGL